VRVQFYKMLIHLILCACVASVYLIGVSHYFNTLKTPLSTNYTLMHGISAFLVIVSIYWSVSALKCQVERILDVMFPSEPTTELTELKELPATFSECDDNQSLLNLVLNVLNQIVPTHDLTILKKEIKGSNYCVVAKHSKSADSQLHHVLTSNDPLIESLANNPRPIVINKVSKGIHSSAYQSLIHLRDELNLSLLIPFFSNQQIYGLILLGPPCKTQGWDYQTTAVLFNLGAQIGNHFRTLELEALVELRCAELKQRNQQLEKAHIEKRNLLTSFSHEIRNPLNGIINISQLLAEEKGLTNTQSELINYLISCKQHLEQLIIPTLDYSSLEAGIYNCTEESFDVNVIIKGLIAMHSKQAARKGLQLNCDLTEVTHTWFGPVTPLRQILINLISNAIKFTGSGSVKLQLSYKQHEDNITATFSVKDSGSGIALNQQDAIFRPLSSGSLNKKNQPGSGVGLSISRRIAQTLHGTLRLKNPGAVSGSVFELTLPFKLGTAINVNTRRNKTQAVLNQKCVLLADDMDFNRYAYRILLERMGATVVEVSNGEQALEKLQSEKFDVVILDINMPVKSGIEVAQEYFLISTDNHPLFIAYSALTDTETVKNCLSAGFSHFIEKPLTADKLSSLFNSKKDKSCPPQGSLLDYLGGENADKVAQLELRYRRSYTQGLTELVQVTKRRDQSAIRSCVHKLRGLACLQKNPNVMKTLDEITLLIAANTAPDEYTQLINQLTTYVTDNPVPISN
jgi:signal transduction histidine kinase/CheY-like chemotaxis protein